MGCYDIGQPSLACFSAVSAQMDSQSSLPPAIIEAQGKHSRNPKMTLCCKSEFLSSWNWSPVHWDRPYGERKYWCDGTVLQTHTGQEHCQKRNPHDTQVSPEQPSSHLCLGTKSLVTKQDQHQHYRVSESPSNPTPWPALGSTQWL